MNALKVSSQGSFSITANEEQQNQSENSDCEQNNIEEQIIQNCIISPNQQIICILCQKIYCQGSTGYCIIFIDVNTNQKLYQTDFKTDDDFDIFPGQFTFDSQYFGYLIDKEIKIINIENKDQITQNLSADRIIDIDTDLNIKIGIDDRIVIYSIEENQIINEYGYEELEDDYLIDQIQDEIYLTSSKQKRLSFNFNEKSIQTIYIKNLIYEKSNDYKIHSNGIISITNNNKKKFYSILCDIRSKKQLRNYKFQKTNNKNNKNVFCNSQLKNEQIYAFSINNNKYYRFNIMKGVLKQLQFKINQKFDQIILSDNVVVGINKDYSELRYFCFV